MQEAVGYAEQGLWILVDQGFYSTDALLTRLDLGQVALPLIVRPNTIGLLEENRGRTLFVINRSKIFSDHLLE